MKIWSKHYDKIIKVGKVAKDILLAGLLTVSVIINLRTGIKADDNGRAIELALKEQRATIDYLNGQLDEFTELERSLDNTIGELNNGIRIAEEYRRETLAMGDKSTESSIIGDQQERIIRELRRRLQEDGE